MKVRLFAVIGMAAGIALAAQAQTAIEYGTISTSAASVLAAPKTSSLATHTVPDLGSHKASGTNVGGHKSVKVWQEKDARSIDAAPSKPTPPAVFILANGEHVESSNYFMTTNSLQLVQNGQQRTIPLSALNANATVAANRQRGVDMKIPDNKGQITISF